MNQAHNERLYYSISEVAQMTGLKPYVLRFWEKEFPVLRPKKNRAGNRSYQTRDIDLIRQIKHLLYEEGFTIEGARAQLRNSRPIKERQLELEKSRLKDFLVDLRKELVELLRLVNDSATH